MKTLSCQKNGCQKNKTGILSHLSAPIFLTDAFCFAFLGLLAWAATILLFSL